MTLLSSCLSHGKKSFFCHCVHSPPPRFLSIWSPNLWRSWSSHRVRNSSTSVLNSVEYRRCTLCFPSGITCSLRNRSRPSAQRKSLRRAGLCWNHLEPLMFCWRYSGWHEGTMGSLAPWMISVGQEISCSISIQMFPDENDMFQLIKHLDRMIHYCIIIMRMRITSQCKEKKHEFDEVDKSADIIIILLDILLQILF